MVKKKPIVEESPEDTARRRVRETPPPQPGQPGQPGEKGHFGAGDYRGGQGGLGGQGGSGSPGGAGGVGGEGGTGGTGGVETKGWKGYQGIGFDEVKPEKHATARVFEKQFIILIAIVGIGTAVFAFNPYLILQGQEQIRELSVQTKIIATESVKQNVAQQNGIIKLLENQNNNSKTVRNFITEQRAKESATGTQWLEFLNTILLDIEQTQDERFIGLHLNNSNDLITENGTHVLFAGKALKLKNGVPIVNLTG